MIHGCAVVESTDVVVVSFDLPTAMAGDVTLDLAHGVLRAQAKGPDGRLCERTALIPEDAVTDSVDAIHADGVLTVTLHKRRGATHGATMTRPLSVVTACPATISRPGSLARST